MRRNLLAQARGLVLEVATGTGKNFRFYPPSCSVIAVDLSREMLERARNKAGALDRGYPLALMDAERLGFRDHVFNTVVSTLSTCTFPNPIQALQEMSRVCRPDGSILLVEHGRSDRGWAARYQDRRADAHARMTGCHWNREPVDLVREAGLRIVRAERRFLGMFHSIEARPG